MIATASPSTAGAVTGSQLADTLADPTIQADLTRFVGDIHRRVVGVGTGAVTLDAAAVDRLVTAAEPTISPAELAKIPPVSFDVPRAGGLNSSRRLVADHWWLIGLVGLAMVAAGVATTDDRRDAVKVIGRWLIGLSLVQLLFLWVIPVWVVPAATDNVWALVVSKVACALEGGCGRAVRDLRGGSRRAVRRPVHPEDGRHRVVPVLTYLRS